MRKRTKKGRDREREGKGKRKSTRELLFSSMDFSQALFSLFLSSILDCLIPVFFISYYCYASLLHVSTEYICDNRTLECERWFPFLSTFFKIFRSFYRFVAFSQRIFVRRRLHHRRSLRCFVYSRHQRYLYNFSLLLLLLLLLLRFKRVVFLLFIAIRGFNSFDGI